MKCATCSYEHIIPFTKVRIWSQEHEAYVCPQCGTLQVDVGDLRNYVKYSGCTCPWCGNTHHKEFAIVQSDPIPRYSLCCSCGARGPDADSELEAITEFKSWLMRKPRNKNEEEKQ